MIPHAEWQRSGEGQERNRTRQCLAGALLLSGLAAFFRRLLLLRRTRQVLHDHRYPPVGGMRRILRMPQLTVGESAHLGHLLRPDAVLLHQPAGRVRAVRGQLPVGIGARPE